MCRCKLKRNISSFWSWSKIHREKNKRDIYKTQINIIMKRQRESHRFYRPLSRSLYLLGLAEWSEEAATRGYFLERIKALARAEDKTFGPTSSYPGTRRYAGVGENSLPFSPCSFEKRVAADEEQCTQIVGACQSNFVSGATSTRGEETRIEDGNK